MGKVDRISQGGNQSVSLVGQNGGEPVLGRVKGREDQDPACVDARSPFLRDSHPFQSPGRTDDHRLNAAQQDVQAFLFDRRMKSADDASTLIAPFLRLIQGL